MYFVTIKRAGYCMFCTTQREAAAVALTEDQQRVHLLERTSDGYVMRREVPVAEQSHTAIMLRLGRHPEPATFDEFARFALEG